jgi:hypothetical protein
MKGAAILPGRIDAHAIKSKPRVRSTAHRDWVRSHHCCVPGCGAMPIEVAHINRASTRGMGQKSSDAFTVSLCLDHHLESHQGERSFEANHKIDLLAMARSFYEHSPYRRRLDNPWE